MNMISTGAFLNEMDASNKQPTLAGKFAAVWEKKNAKAARAGGVSLMALSLAACGSSSTTTTTTDTTTDTTTTPVTPAVDAAKEMFLTSSVDAGSAFTGGSGADTFYAGNSTLTAGDDIDGGAGTDALYFTDSSTAGSAMQIALIDNIETLYVNNAAGRDAVSASTAVSEKQTVTLSGITSSAGAVTFLGIQTASQAASATAATVATAVAAKKADILAGAQGQALGLTDITASSGVLTLTFGGTNGVGDVASLASSISKGVTFGAGAETVTGKAAVSAVSALTPTQTISLSGTDVTTAYNNGSKNAVAFTDIAAGTTVGVQSVTAGANATSSFTFAAAATNTTTDSVSLNVDSNTSAGTVTIGAGFETVNITATGTKSVIATLTTGAKTVNISGDGALTVTNAIVGATTIDGSGATGKLDVESATNKVTIKTGSAADKIEMSHANSVAIEATIDAGAGNDTVTFTSSDGEGDLVDSKVTISGGDGEDTLVITNALASSLGGLGATALAKKGISGFEKLQISDLTTTSAINTTKLGQTYLDLAAGQGANATFTVLDGTTMALGAAASAAGDTATIAVSGASAAGSDDTFTLKMDAAHASGTIDYGKLSVANVETVTVDSTTARTTPLATTDKNNIDLVAANATKLVVTGDTTLILTGDPFDGVIANADITGFTGTSIDISFAGGAAVTYSGSEKVDNVTGSSNADVITGGGGKDVITGGAEADTMTGGAAADTFKINTVNDSKEATMDKITDFTLNSDVLHTVGNIDDSNSQARTASTLESAASGTDVKGATTDTDTDVTASITAGGKITLGGAEKANVDTLAEWMDVAEIMLSSNTTIATDDVNSSIGFFEFNGNTYVVEETTTDATNSETVTAHIIELTGLTGATGLSTTAADGYILIA